MSPRERHRTGHTGWLRAAVMGADDGILSTASPILGVAAAHGTHSSVLIAGIAGLVAGAMSMAAGEYVSVHSQKDTELADLALERTELRIDEPVNVESWRRSMLVAASIRSWRSRSCNN